MANKFLNGIEVSSSAVVDGGSLSTGSTILDIQGSQGQLFSVTNSLVGDLFSVSDISGVPILNVNSSGAVNIDGTLSLGDSNKIQLGASQDLQIYHDGSNSYIQDTGTGDLIISADNDLTFKDGSGNIMANMNASNSVELMFGNSKKFETTSTGVSVTGSISAITASGHSFMLGNSNNTSSADTSGFRLHQSSYTDGRYTHRFRKYDQGGGVPLYIDGSVGTANIFTALARFGTYTGESKTFEVFGTIGATNLSGTNTGDQDLSGYSTTSHNHDGRYLRTHARYSDDLDTINSSGVYIWDVSEADDEPTGAGDGLLTIKYWDSSNWATASFQDFHNRTLHIKSKKSGTWQSDWAQVWTTDQLTTTNKANYDTAYTHSQATHAPTDAEANVQADWNATSGDALILNKPTVVEPGLLYRQTGANDSASIGPGWITVAKNQSSRRHGEVIVSDSESSDHAFIRIDWMRSYADSNFSVLNVGGHANRITGVRVLSQDSDDTYGWKYLQVYVTVASVYGTRVHTLGTPRGYTNHTSMTPILENTKTGYSVHGNALEDLDTSSLAAEEGLTVGGDIAVGGTVDGVDISALPTSFAPTDAEANVQADWNATTGDALILNKPTIPTDFVSATTGGNFGGNLSVHTGASTGSLSVGRTSDQSIKLYITDTNNSITAAQDSDSNSEHNFILNRTFAGTGANNFKIQKGGTDQFTLNSSGLATFAGSVQITGALTVNGTTTTINTATVEVEDNILQLNTTQGTPDTATATTSGISIYRGVDENDVAITEASLIFDDGDDTWDLTNNLTVAGDVTGSNLSGTNTGDQDLSGYLTSLPSHNHDDRYYTETEIDAQNVTLNETLAALRGWVPGFSNSDDSSLTWDRTEDALRINSSTDTSIGAVYKAMRVIAGMTIRVTVTVKGDVAGTDGLYLRLQKHDGNLPDGKTHVSHDEAGSSEFVQEDDSEILTWYENGAISTDWVTHEKDVTITSGGYISFLVLNWTGNSNDSVWVKTPDIQIVTAATSATVVTNANLTGGVTSVGNAATVVTNANLTGHVTSVGNAAVLGSFTTAELNAAISDGSINIDQTLPTDFVSAASGGTFSGNIDASNLSGTNTGDNSANTHSSLFIDRGSIDVTTSSGGSNSNPFDNAHTETKISENGMRTLTYTGASAFMYTFANGGSASVVQYGAHYNGNDFYMRTRTDGSTWNNWRKLYHDNNIPTWNQNTTGNAATASSATIASRVTINSGFSGTYPMLVEVESSGIIYNNTNVTYNGTSNTLTSPNFSGNLTGNVTGNVTGSAGSVAWGNITSRPYIVNASNNSATATTTIANVAHATYTAAFFDFVIKNGTNVRAGTVYACHNGASTPLVEFAETSTVDLGDTSDVTLAVDISGANMRLRATTTSSTWTIKSLIRAI